MFYYHSLSRLNISWKIIHSFSSNAADRRTDRRRDNYSGDGHDNWAEVRKATAKVINKAPVFNNTKQGISKASLPAVKVDIRPQSVCI